jgi:hypothetical protein
MAEDDGACEQEARLSGPEAEFDFESPHATKGLHAADATDGGAADARLVCEVCEEGQAAASDDPVLACTSCAVAVHRSCYGAALPTRDDAPWSCDACAARAVCAGEKPRCVLCRVRGGAVKQALPLAGGRLKAKGGGGWAHVFCVLWTPELTLDGASMRATSLATLDPARAGLGCSACGGRGRAVVQCAEPSCVAGAHPFCARSRRWVLLDEPIVPNAASDFQMLCPAHRHLQQRRPRRSPAPRPARRRRCHRPRRGQLRQHRHPRRASPSASSTPRGAKSSSLTAWWTRRATRLRTAPRPPS